MLLEYNPAKQTYILRVRRSEGIDIQEIIKEHGLDYSTSASHNHEAVLFTREPCAALHFYECGTDEVKRILAPLKEQVDLSWAPDSKANIKCPADKELWGFQKASVDYALQRRNTLVGDQPGLGKTPIAICFANEIAAKRVLVLCPANIRLQWAARVREWSTMSWPNIVYPILKGSTGVHPQANWTIVSYDLARTPAIGRALAAGKYDLLILDEGHYLKTIDSKRTRAVFGGGILQEFPALEGRCGSIMALTGTPLPNRPREAYTLARGLCWDAIDFTSEDKFKERFNPSMTKEIIDKVTGKTKFVIDERSGRHFELQNRLRSNFMVRHLKRDVMPQLKMPDFDIIHMEETGPVKAALKAESLLDLDPEELEDPEATNNFELKGHIAVVRRQMGIALAPQIASYVDMLIDGGEEKLVIFAWHIEVLNILQNALQRHGVIRIDGSTGAAKKQRLVDQFVDDPQYDVMLGNMQSIGTGTDGLQKVAWHALVAEASWVPGDNEQAIDRLDRGGQNNTVQADFFVAPGSISEKVLASSLRKRQTTHKSLDARMA